jgi:uncharacterized protein YwgA
MTEQDFDLYTTDLSETWDELPVDDQPIPERGRKDRQLNLRVSGDLLSALRGLAARRNESYHALARGFIEQGLLREETTADSPAQRPFSTKEATLVLLAAPGQSHELNEEVSGRTRLQKLLFLLTQHLQADVQARFEAFHYGPFEENLNADIEFLTAEGLVEGPGSLAEIELGDGDRGARLVEWVRARTGPANELVESYRLTKRGMDWVQRFLADPTVGREEPRARLFEESARLKERFGRVSLDALIDHVYDEYPEYAENSKIRGQVAERRRRSNE